MPSSLYMPKAVAVWLVDNTSMTFEQIAHVCGMHVLEVQSIADGESEDSCILGCDPRDTGEISKDEIIACESDSSRMPVVSIMEDKSSRKKKTKKSSTYTPIARRRAKPDAVMWLLRHSKLDHKQIASLIGTTVNTVESIADKTYWNVANLRPRDPVMLRLCSAEQLEDAMLAAKIAKEKDEIYLRAQMKEESLMRDDANE